MRITLSRFITCASLLAASTLAAPADDAYFASPPAVTAEGQPALSTAETPVFHAEIAGPTQYTIGQPTSQEQYLLELLNRARANAPAEAIRLATSTDGNISGAIKFFAVNIAAMKAQFATLPSPLPPLAFSGNLMESAYLQSLDMKENNFQGHVSSNNPPAPDQPGDTLGDRLNHQNYDYDFAAENVFAYGLDLDSIQASFEIDWGPDNQGAVDGMQAPPGHRYNDHDLDDSLAVHLYQEIGISVLTGPGNGNGNTTGPLITTFDIGFQFNAVPLITGVVYKDNDGNGFYTPGNINNPSDFGEGVGNVTVTVSNTTFYAVTTKSGGYTVPVPGDCTYTVSFSGGGLANFTENVTVSGGNNVEADYVIPAVAPVTITKSPATQTVLLGKAATFTVTATSTAGTLVYQWYSIIGSKTTKISGATKSTYAISKTAATNAGKYYVVVQNAKGNATSSQATLSLLTGVKIGSLLKPATAKAGQTAPVTFSVTASGTSPLKYVWELGGQPIIANNVTGNTTAKLTISKVTAANAGSYQVTVSNSLNGLTSSANSTAKLTVTVPKSTVK